MGAEGGSTKTATAWAYGLALGLVLGACGSDDGPRTAQEDATRDAGTTAPGTTPPRAPPAACDGDASCGAPAPVAPSPPSVLRVKFLGVMGFLLEHGAEALLTAPLFTRPNMIQVSTGLPVTSDATRVAAELPATALANVKAVLAGHAHYDHLLDVPAVMARAPGATLYSNRSAKNLLAAYAPDRAAACADKPAPADVVARSRVVALDDPATSVVDYRGCPDKRPAGAPLEGTWVNVPGAHQRVLAVCSEHPDQIGPGHFAPGDVTEEACTPPKKMADWKEGLTLGFLVDFLDPTTGALRFRVYYEDAPAGTPVGQVPAAVLAGRDVDLALLCVGAYGPVENAPSNTITTLRPRFALGGHWEDFFRGLDETPAPIPLLDLATWDTRAAAAMKPSADPKPLVKNGAPVTERVLRPAPGDVFEIR